MPVLRKFAKPNKQIIKLRKAEINRIYRLEMAYNNIPRKILWQTLTSNNRRKVNTNFKINIHSGSECQINAGNYLFREIYMNLLPD